MIKLLDILLGKSTGRRDYFHLLYQKISSLVGLLKERSKLSEVFYPICVAIKLLKVLLRPRQNEMGIAKSPQPESWFYFLPPTNCLSVVKGGDQPWMFGKVTIIANQLE